MSLLSPQQPPPPSLSPQAPIVLPPDFAQQLAAALKPQFDDVKTEIINEVRKDMEAGFRAVRKDLSELQDTSDELLIALKLLKSRKAQRRKVA